MNTDAKNFPQGTDVKDILYLIWQELSKSNGSASSVKRYEVTDITGIAGSLLDALQCGDQVVKLTGSQRHVYTVSYKGVGVGQGICLTYVDAGTVETVAYDYTADGWVYNSTDHTTLTPDA